MTKVFIKRGVKKGIPEAHGNFGRLNVSINDNIVYSCYTGELPSRDNKHDISCIPIGEYLCVPTIYDKKPHYLISHVKDRGEVLFHIGNWCGDKSKGLKSDSRGCILLGLDIICPEKNAQWQLKDSKLALNAFHRAINGDSYDDDHKTWKPFKLYIS